MVSLPENRDDWTIEAAVKHEFEKFGIVYVKIRRDPNGMPFAFVQFTVSIAMSQKVSDFFFY